MRQWLGIILSLLLAIVLVNDVSRIAATHFAMDDVAVTAADAASSGARNAPDDPGVGFERAAAIVASEDATITGYSQEDGRVRVWVEGPVEGTFVISPIASLWAGDEWDTPMTVAKNHERPY